MATATVEPTIMSVRKPPKPAIAKPDTEPVSPRERALKLMREPFPENQISKICKPTRRDNPAGACRDCGGYHKIPSKQLSYVGHAALTDRLLDADPEWTWEPLALTPMGTPQLDPDGSLWIKLTVAGVSRLGCGDAQGKTGGDAMKERIGDALRNAAMRFGAALDLWHKGTLHVDEKPEEEEETADARAAAPQPEPVQQQYPPRLPVTRDRPSQPVGSITPFDKNVILSAVKKSGKSSQQLTAFLHTNFGYDALDEMPKRDLKDALKWAMEA